MNCKNREFSVRPTVIANKFLPIRILADTVDKSNPPKMIQAAMEFMIGGRQDERILIIGATFKRRKAV